MTSRSLKSTMYMEWGELVAIYDKAAYAIQRAEQISGVVISSEQAYVWEKGNRDLVYDTETAPFGNEKERPLFRPVKR